MRTGLTIAVCGLTLLIFFAGLSVVGVVDHQHILMFNFPWFSAFNINLDFKVDGLSLLFLILISFMGLVVFCYSYFYLKGSKLYKRYLLYLTLFMLAMLGTVLADNMILLFIFWEATSLTSYLLICYSFQKESSQRAALQGLLVTVSGGIALLLLAFLLHSVTDSWRISELAQYHQALIHSRYFALMLILFLLAIATKSAQWPFHFWLPNAMEAPTPVSAYLHSSTMVKLGLYLVARFTLILGGNAAWHFSLGGLAIVTLVVTGVLLFLQFDLKRLLAYSTIMALSLVILLLADDTPLSVQAAIAFLFVHALYKAALFLCAGNIDKFTGSRNIENLSGLAFKMPLTFIAVIIAAASLAGLPPVVGFVIKELIYEAKLAGDMTWLYLTVSFLCNVVFVCFALTFVILPFFGKSKMQLPARESMSLGFFPLLLAVISLIFGIWPEFMNKYLIRPAVSSILQTNVTHKLAVWHGVNTAFIFSLLTLLSGIIVFCVYLKFKHKLKKHKFNYGTESLYGLCLELLNRWSRVITHVFQSGQLREYVAIVFLFVSVVMWGTYIHFNDIHIAHWLPHAPWFDWLIVLVLIGGAGSMVRAAPYFVSLIMLGVVGLATMLVFLIYSAPDVAMTQLLVDILTVVIFVLALYRLPRLPKLQSMSRLYLWRNAAIAIVSGLLITCLMLTSISVPFNNFINDFYTANSLFLAHGKNVVNVILVDFRAFDTLGESLVVAMAGFGVYGLWRHFFRKIK